MKFDCFVFGSNLKGIHGRGAAKVAADEFGAVYGVGEGMEGSSYALPTKKTPYENMTLEEVKIHVERFIRFAHNNPQIIFKVTCVGCGLAGFKNKDIAPLFYDAPANCLFDLAWKKYIDVSFRKYWGGF